MSDLMDEATAAIVSALGEKFGLGTLEKLSVQQLRSAILNMDPGTRAAALEAVARAYDNEPPRIRGLLGFETEQDDDE